MFVPLRDHNPLVIIPFEYVNVGLIAVCVVVFAVFQSGLFLDAGADQYSFAVIPAVVLETAQLPPEMVVLPWDLSLATYMFLHGGWLHLAANMLFLWVFGDNLEDAMGHLTYLGFFLLCGVAAGLAHTFAQPDSTVPLVGASGAIAGVVGGYLILHPRVRVWVLVFWRIPLPIPAYLALGFWIALQLVNAVLAAPDDHVAWFAHLGGLGAGLVLTPLLKRRQVPLFDRGVSH